MEEKAARVRREGGLPAPAEVVFSSLTDPHRVARCLPAQIQAHATGRRVRLAAPGLADAEYQVCVERSRLTVQWTSRSDGPAWPGRVEVAELPAGGCRVLIEVDGAPAEQEPVGRLVDEFLVSLRREVAENFTPG